MAKKKRKKEGEKNGKGRNKYAEHSKVEENMKKRLTIILLGLFLISFTSAGLFDPGSELAFHEEGKNGKWGYYEINDTDFWFFNNKPVKTIELIENDYSIYTAWNIKEIEIFKPTKLFDKTNYLDKEQKEDRKSLISSQLHLFREWEAKTRIIPYFECLTYETITNSSGSSQVCVEEQDNSYTEEYREWGDWKLYNFGTVQEGLYQTKTIVTRTQQATGIIDWVDENEGYDLDKWETWWNNDWGYKREISSLNGTISALYNITYSGEMKVDFSDVRFVDSATETTELNYTLIDKINSTTARFRVNNNNETNITMYYGNPTATDNSDAGDVYYNGETVYLFDTQNANDFSGNGYNAVVTGATFTTSGRIGGAYVFSSGDKINDDDNPIRTATEGAISVWVKPASVSGNGEFIASGDSGSTGTPYFYIGTSGSGSGHVEISMNTGANNVERSTGTSMVAGNWYNIVVTNDGSKNYVFINGVVQPVSLIVGSAGKWFSDAVGTDTLAFGLIDRSTDGGFYTGTMDENYLYDYNLTQTIVTNIYKQSLPNFTVGAEEMNIGLSTTLIAPSDALQTTEKYQNFTFQSIPLTVNLTNATLNIWNATDNTLLISNFTTLSGNETVNTTFSNNLTQGNYIWGATTKGTAGVSSESSNRTLTIHTTTPSVTITAPEPLTDYILLGNNLTLNWTITETGENLTSHITNCTYEYNGTLTILNNTLCTKINTTSFVYAQGVNNLTFTVTDILGLVNSTVYTWIIKLTEINQTYNAVVTEGSLETFLANIRLGTGYSITSAVLFNYNGSSSIGQSFDIGDDTILRKADFLTPNVDADTNVTFYWNVTLSDSTNIILSSQNQTIKNLGIDNCSSFTNELFNFTVVDEEEQTILPNATIEVAVNVYDATRTSLVLNYSDLFEEVNPLTICLNLNISNSSTYSVDTIVRYEDINHANEYYNMVNQTLTNESTSQIITLYDLSLNDSTEFQLTFTGSDFLPVENALVNVDRQYISENLFKTVELPKTDFNGQSVLHLVRNDVIYNVVITKEGVVLGNFENLVAFCDDFTIGDCNIVLNAFDSVEAVFEYSDDIGIIFQQPTYNATKDLVSFVFVTSDGSAKDVVLQVTRNDIFGNRSVCNSSIVSSGATLTCSTPSNLDDSELNTQIYVNDILSVKTTVEISSSNYGAGGYLIAFVLSLSLALLFSGSKTGILFSMILSLSVTIGLGITEGNLIGLGASGIWLLIIIIVGIYKLNKDRQP